MKIIASFLMLLTASCSSFQARKAITESEIIFHNGTYQNNSWDDDLVFTRYSWFHDATMDQDILVAKIDNESSFNKWLGKDLLRLRDCSGIYIVLSYDREGNSGIVTSIDKKIRGEGGRSIEIVGFKQELKSHQNYADWNLKNHKFQGFCALNSSLSVSLDLPGYRAVSIEK